MALQHYDHGGRFAGRRHGNGGRLRCRNYRQSNNKRCTLGVQRRAHGSRTDQRPTADGCGMAGGKMLPQHIHNAGSSIERYTDRWQIRRTAAQAVTFTRWLHGCCNLSQRQAAQTLQSEWQHGYPKRQDCRDSAIHPRRSAQAELRRATMAMTAQSSHSSYSAAHKPHGFRLPLR